MLTVEHLAISLRESLGTSEGDGVRLRLVRQFVMDANQGDTASLIAESPESTGSPQWDALLAASPSLWPITLELPSQVGQKRRTNFC